MIFEPQSGLTVIGHLSGCGGTSLCFNLIEKELAKNKKVLFYGEYHPKIAHANLKISRLPGAYPDIYHSFHDYDVIAIDNGRPSNVTYDFLRNAAIPKKHTPKLIAVLPMYETTGTHKYGIIGATGAVEYTANSIIQIKKKGVASIIKSRSGERFDFEFDPYIGTLEQPPIIAEFQFDLESALQALH